MIPPSAVHHNINPIKLVGNVIKKLQYHLIQSLVFILNKCALRECSQLNTHIVLTNLVTLQLRGVYGGAIHNPLQHTDDRAHRIVDFMLYVFMICRKAHFFFPNALLALYFISKRNIQINCTEREQQKQYIGRYSYAVSQQINAI